MNEVKESPGTTKGTEAITSSAQNLNDIQFDEQSGKVYDSLFDSVPTLEREDTSLDALIPEESPGDLEKSELLRQATQAACAHICRLRERGSKVTPPQIEKLVLTMLNTSIAQHNKETKDRLPRYQELPPAVLAEVFAFEHPVTLVGTGTPTSPAHLSLAVYESEGGLKGTYRILDQAELHALLRPYCFSITVRQAAETYAHLRAIAPVIDETMDPTLVPVANGVFNTDTQQLEPFSPERAFLTKSPVAYDPNAVSPVKTLKDGTEWEFDQWLADLFSDDQDRITLFWEIVASSLRVYKCYEKAFLFFSESRLSEIEHTLSTVAEQLTAKSVVRLPSGEPVNKSDLESYIMMRNLKEAMETTSSSLGELKKTVGNGRTVKVDVEALGKFTVGVLDQRLTKAVEAPVQRIEGTLEGFEQGVAEIGAKRVSETTKQVEKALDKAHELIKEIGHAERRLEALERRVTWTSVSRHCVALLPLAAVLLVVGGLTMGVFHALGFGPLLGWTWGSFTAASAWWAKALIAVGTLGGIALFSSVIWWAVKKINDELRTW